MTYYVSPTGNDDIDNLGTDPDSPFRSLTRCMHQIARDYPDGLETATETVTLAAGRYTRADGEMFPIAIPVGVEVRGAGAEESIIEFEPEVPTGECIGSRCIDLHGTLTNVTVASVDEEFSWTFCAVCTRTRNAVVEDAKLQSMVIDSGNIIRRVHVRDFLRVVEPHRESNDDEGLFPLVTECSDSAWGDVGRCYFLMSGGRLEHCETRGDVRTGSPSDTLIRNNDMPNIDGVVVSGYAELTGPLPRIEDNTFGKEEMPGVTVLWITGECEWRRNQIWLGFCEFAADGLFEDNTITALQTGIRQAYPWSNFPVPRHPDHSIMPVFRNNIISQSSTVSRWLLPGPCVTIADNARPLFRGNTFRPISGGIHILSSQASPDFGRNGESDDDHGNNSFYPPFGVPDILVDIGAGASLVVHAAGNAWTRDPPWTEPASGDITFEVEPHSTL